MDTNPTQQDIVDLPGAELKILPNFLSTDDADELYRRLMDLEWQQGEVTVFGRTWREPRKTIFFSDTGVVYKYSGKTNPSIEIPGYLQVIVDKLRILTGITFNGILANYYADGNETIGQHADNEQGMGKTIPSLSLGATRKFAIKPKKMKNGLPGRVAYNIQMTNGMLVIMAGQMQKHYVHSVPRQKRVAEGRINLTFRQFLQ